MAKSATGPGTQSDAGEPVELEKTGEDPGQERWPTGSSGESEESARDASGKSGASGKDGNRFGGRLRRGRRAGAGASASEPTATEATTGEATTSGAADTAARSEPTSRSGRGLDAARLRKVIVGLLVLALLLAVVLLIQVIKGPGNSAKIAARTDRGDAARQAADTQVARLFSFNYKTLDADFKAQRDVTTGPFTQEIENVTNPAVRPLAAKEHVVVQAVSLDSAVVDDSGSDVQVLVFLNQAVTLDLLPAPRLDRNRLLATMRFVDGQWKVAGIKAL